MNTEEKGRLYEHYVSQAGLLERKNSTLKSHHVINIPENIQKEINENQAKIDMFQIKINDLFR
jgi:hypothetical protein|tara:strand:- start:273 stop:461 length:189 start_codon:yes stop_codon:yes gene_type:complete